MKRSTPDRTYAAAARVELIRRVGASPGRPTRPHRDGSPIRSGGFRFIEVGAAVAVLALIVTVVLGLQRLTPPAGHHALSPSSITTPTSRPTPTPTTGSTAEIVCDDGKAFAPFTCGTYRELTGRYIGRTVTWTTTPPLQILFRAVDGTRQVQITDACTTYIAQAPPTGDTWKPATTARHAAGTCNDADAEKDRAVNAFFADAISFHLDGNELRLTGTSGAFLLSRQDDHQPSLETGAYTGPLIAPNSYRQLTPAQIRAYDTAEGETAVGIDQDLIITHCMAEHGYLYDPTVARSPTGLTYLHAGLTKKQETDYGTALYGPDSDATYNWRTAGCKGLAVHQTGQDNAH